MSGYEYLIKLKDYASSGLRKIAESAGVTDNKLKKVKQTSGGLKNRMNDLKRSLIGVFSIALLSSFVNKTIEARSEFERFDAVLSNTFQDEAIGKAALNLLTNFAEQTPFQLNELTDSFVKLVNRGFAPTRDELTKLGDLASSQGKSFGQLTEAILDAETNEFERLKEFGIKAKKSGDQVTLSFKGISKTVSASGGAIRDAILEFGGMKGVAGSMEVISKTLGGRISNLQDQWWSFLVAVGGQGGDIFGVFIDLASNGLAFLTKYLPHIAMWFKILWETLAPAVNAVAQFIQELNGFKTTEQMLQSFGSVMLKVLMVVDLLATGIVTLIDWLGPFAEIIAVVKTVWSVLNIVMAASPLTWIVAGIIAIVAAIGFVTKYTKGWGDTFKFTTEGMKLLIETFALFVKAQFTAVINTVMIALSYIQKGWYKFKEAVGMGNSSENQQMIKDISDTIEQRKKAIVDGYKEAAQKGKEAAKAFGITIDTDAIKKDFKNLKDKFKGIGKIDNDTSAYDNYLKKRKLNETKDKIAGDTIVSGGKKHTNINITIHKLQDDTKIYVSQSEKGLNKLGEKTQEMLLRAVNSVNQMQTSK